MSYYEDLADSLRICVKYQRGADALCNAEFAADAIEQLIKERDAAVADLKECGECGFCIRNHDMCDTCFFWDKWQWRGVQVDEK